MLLKCLPVKAKIYFLRPLKEAKFPLPYSLNFVTIKLFYRIAIEQLAKCVREESFQFCLIWSQIDRCERDDGCILVAFFFWGGGGKGESQSTNNISVNAFVSGEPFFVCRKIDKHLDSPSVFMSQGARKVLLGTIEWNQYLPLIASPPSLILISWQVSAGSSGMEPRGTGRKKKQSLA